MHKCAGLAVRMHVSGMTTKAPVSCSGSGSASPTPAWHLRLEFQSFPIEVQLLVASSETTVDTFLLEARYRFGRRRAVANPFFQVRQSMKSAVAIRHVAFEDTAPATVLAGHAIVLRYLEAGVDDLSAMDAANPICW